MALLKSIDLPLGTPLPKFTLPDPKGNKYTETDLMGGRGLLLVVTCNHCPYAVAVWPRLIKLAAFAKGHNINTVAINPNINPSYPEDAPDKMQDKIKEWGIEFPYLVDTSQALAKELQAQCTPDIYLFDATKKLVYHGRIDDNWQDEAKVTRQELKEALLCLTSGKPINPKQNHSMGCSIKWK